MNVPQDNDRKQLEEELREPLSRWMVKPVHSAETSRLIQALQPEFEQLRTERKQQEAYTASFPHAVRPSLAALIWAQLATYPRIYWLASVAVLIMFITILPVSAYVPYQSIGQMVNLILPVLLLGGLLYSFRSWNKEMRTLENITPYPPALLMLCRLLPVLGMALIIGFCATLYLKLNIALFPLLPFTLQWLSLTILLGGVLAYAMLWKGIKPAMIAGTLAWVAWNLAHHQFVEPHPSASGLVTNIHIALLLAGALLLVLAFRRGLRMKVAL